MVADTMTVISPVWGGSTGSGATVKARVHHIKENGTGDELMRVNGAWSAVRRLAVNNETFGDIMDGTNAQIGCNAEDKYYPLYLKGDRDSYGTALYLLQEGDADVQVLMKAGTNYWAAGIDQSDSESFKIGSGTGSNLWFGMNDTHLTITTGGAVTIAQDLEVDGGDITLGGTGRIQGIDTVSAATDAASKDYVDYTQYVRHYMNVGWNSSSTSKIYMPLNGYYIERTSTAGYNEAIAFCAPHDGFLEKVIVRSESSVGNRAKVGFHKSDEGTEVPNSTATELIESNMGNANTAYTFNFTATSSFDKGDILTISFDPNVAASNDTVATIVWKFDTTT
jgi:hypothetical protein